MGLYNSAQLKLTFLTKYCRKPYLLLVLISFCLLRPIQAVVEIGEVGVEKVKQDDIAMIFYTNAINTGSEADTPVAARLKMKSCCLKLSNGGENCEAMKLISGLGIKMHPNKKHTLRMYFPNPNLFDREGTCILQLLTTTSTSSQESWTPGKELSIPFSTVLPEPSISRKLLIAVGGSSEGYRVCNKHNRNARRECGNQDCLVRYNGILSIHNPHTGECEPTPQCSDSSENMLNPLTGKCEPIKDVEELRNSFSHDMLSPNYISSPQHLRLMDHISHPAHQKIVNNCEHGKLINDNCVCDDGWRSMTEEEWIKKGGVVHPEESFVLPRLCNIPVADPMRNGRLLFIMLVIALTTLLLIMGIYCWGRTRERKKTKRDLRQYDYCHRNGAGKAGDDEECDEEEEDEDEEEEEEEEENPEEIINEILNRREQQPRSHRSRNHSSVPSLIDIEQAIESEIMKRQSESGSQGQRSPSQIPTSHAQSTLNQDEIASPQIPPTPPNSSTGSYSVHPFVKDFLPEISPSKIFEKRNTPSNTDITDNASISAVPEPEQAPPPEPPTGSGSNIPTTNRVKRTPSTDEMLTMNRNEMRQAHMPMRPLPSLINMVNNNTTLPRVHEYNSGSGKVTITSMTSLSSEEVTLKKQEEWADYFKTVSPEDLELPVIPKTGHCTISVEDDGESETRRKKKNFLDFHFFNKDRAVGALKVRSLPEMKSVPTPEVKPPETKIKESVEQLSPKEFANRLKAYSILRSLSRSKITDGKENNDENSEVEESPGLTPTKSSIWSNVASLNAEKADPEKASRSSSSESVAAVIRPDSIFGDLGSDEDEEKALESIAMAQGEQAKSKILEKDFENYMKIYGFPQDGRASSTSKDQLQDRILESDKVPSEVYFSRAAEEDTNNDNKIEDMDLKTNSDWISTFLSSPNNQQLYYRRKDEPGKNESNFRLLNTSNNNDNEGDATPTEVKVSFDSSALKLTRSRSDSSINIVNN